MPGYVVVGSQWGDEGKGKIVDLLTERVDIVARYGGGPNAGHTIRVGDRVRWTNRMGAHTTTSGIGGASAVPDGRWDSGFLDEGERFTVKFEEAGTFTYFCEIHPVQMQATVVVEP